MSSKWRLVATNALESFEPEANISNYKERNQMRAERRRKDIQQEMEIREMLVSKPKKQYDKKETITE